MLRPLALIGTNGDQSSALQDFAFQLYRRKFLQKMGNTCCGGNEYEAKNHRSISGNPPPPKVMTPAQDELREQARAAAEERARVNAVRGTHRQQ